MSCIHFLETCADLLFCLFYGLGHLDQKAKSVTGYVVHKSQFISRWLVLNQLIGTHTVDTASFPPFDFGWKMFLFGTLYGILFIIIFMHHNNGGAFEN